MEHVGGGHAVPDAAARLVDDRRQLAQLAVAGAQDERTGGVDAQPAGAGVGEPDRDPIRGRDDPNP